jgi:hypothetical protein
MKTPIPVATKPAFPGIFLHFQEASNTFGPVISKSDLSVYPCIGVRAAAARLVDLVLALHGEIRSINKFQIILYHMVDWATVCRPKEVGVLGILNTRHMNIALMLKWVWKLYHNADGLWADLIRAKYLGEHDLFSPLVPTKGSQFWNSIQRVKWYFKLGAKHSVRNGKRTFFWLDWWLGTSPLRDRYPVLFSCCTSPFITVLGLGMVRGGACSLDALSPLLRRLNGTILPGSLTSLRLALRMTWCLGAWRLLVISPLSLFIAGCRRERRSHTLGRFGGQGCHLG